jgi:hypothetical protein
VASIGCPVADKLAGEAAAEKKLGEPQSPGLKKEFPYTTPWRRTPKLKRDKDSILPPAPKNSFLDGAPNRPARTIA